MLQKRCLQVIANKMRTYFNMLIDGLTLEYGQDGFDYSRSYNSSPASFPHIYFKQLNNADALDTLSGECKGANNTVEIRAYHNEGIAKAENFAWKVKQIMVEDVGLRCSYFSQVDNISDPKIIQYVMRFTTLEV